MFHFGMNFPELSIIMAIEIIFLLFAKATALPFIVDEQLNSMLNSDHAFGVVPMKSQGSDLKVGSSKLGCDYV